MREIAAYVEDLVSRLECDPLKRDEIRLEAHLHLRELVDAEMAAGADAEAAQETAIRQFGPVEEVAARLAMIHDLTPIPPAAVHRPGVVMGWGLVVAPVVVAIRLFAPVAILPDYLIWITTTATVYSHLLDRDTELLAGTGDEHDLLHGCGPSGCLHAPFVKRYIPASKRATMSSCTRAGSATNTAE